MGPRSRAGLLSACLILCLALTVISCSKNNSSSQGIDTPLDLPPGSSAITNAANQFALNTFQQVLQTEPRGANTLISPLSIYLALGITYNGAAGATADSMAATLDLAGIPAGELNAVCKALLQQLPKEDNKVQLSLANSIWYGKQYPQPTPAFQDTIGNAFLSTIQGLDFTAAQAALNTINSWVAKNTNNKIPTILSHIDPSTLIVLANAIYFNGAWLNAFKTSDTQNEPFVLANGSNVTVPFMNQTAELRAYQNTQFTLAELPYGTGKAFDMYLVIPTQTSASVYDFAASLNAATLANAVSHLDSVKAKLTIPKWEYSYSIDNMKTELTQMGMGIAFSDDEADFTKMYPATQMNLSQVAHKTYIQVSEAGTQAAAATAVVGITTTSIIGGPIPIKADHPFVYLIVEKQTGTILFTGIVNDPSQH